MKLQDLSSGEMELLTEALHRLRDVKVEAHASVVKAPGHERFTLADFGVPKIDTLLAKLDTALDADDFPIAA